MPSFTVMLPKETDCEQAVRMNKAARRELEVEQQGQDDGRVICERSEERSDERSVASFFLRA